ncbi:hypothetical protein [Clostridium sp. YIM B02506]|uniref:hypothetical protein n=1 Tax=Clostridium sp. YIM B02506 TaxID=2910680 RepID=UPI001EEF4C6B|nr:hypothetical protein [Clostridium sp. YIM B02506]
MKISINIGLVTSLIITGYLAISNFNRSRILFWLFTIAFLFGLIGFIVELISKQRLHKSK